jgi:hypothetical protein
MMRYARYAAAWFFALAAVGFVALWVRSYFHFDQVYGPIGSLPVCLSSDSGAVMLHSSGEVFNDWTVITFEPIGSPYPNLLGFTVLEGYALRVPYWFLVASSLGLAALFAFKPITRFTVRGLLITTTLLASVLGLAVYAV